MNIVLWVLQVLLALHTAMGAFWKFSHAEDTVPALKVIPHRVWIATCAFDLLCAVGLIVPAFFGPWAVLVPIAALGIAAEMLVYTALQLRSREPNHGEIVYWLVVAIVCGFIAYGRFVLHPF